MSSREEDAKAFAEGMPGWGFTTEDQCLRPSHNSGPRYIRIPAVDAPLHEHMEFVGRIAEAMPGKNTLGSIKYMPAQRAWRVILIFTGADGNASVGIPAIAGDPSHAALIAGESVMWAHGKRQRRATGIAAKAAR